LLEISKQIDSADSKKIEELLNRVDELESSLNSAIVDRDNLSKEIKILEDSSWSII